MSAFYHHTVTKALLFLSILLLCLRIEVLNVKLKVKWKLEKQKKIGSGDCDGDMIQYSLAFEKKNVSPNFETEQSLGSCNTSSFYTCI